MTKFEIYAKELIEKHGIIRADQIAKAMLKKCQRENNTTFFDEADWTMDNKTNTFQLSKKQRPEKVAKKNNRIKTTINFYKEVIIAINKMRS
jgi:hypothetical protein